MGLNLLGDDDHANFFGFLLDKVERLETINAALRERLKKLTAPDATVTEVRSEIAKTETKPRIQVLHEIACSRGDHDHYGTRYFDEPKEMMTLDQRLDTHTWTLRGEKEVYELDSYLTANPEISFVVFKEHVCRESASHQSVEFTPNISPIICACQNCVRSEKRHDLFRVSPRQERLRIVSPHLKKIIRQFQTCRPDGTMIEPVGDYEMEAPYPFLYHHQGELANSLKENGNEKEREHAQLLIDFLRESYAKEYAEADDLFKRGMVSKKHISKLFKPNQVLISADRGQVLAHVLNWWPHLKDRQIHLMVWSWEFNGFKLQRAPKRIAIPFDIDDDIAVTKLSHYPMKYASPELLKELVDRGKRFWTMRTRYFASYNGWDTHHDHYYVSGGSSFLTLTDPKTQGKLIAKIFYRRRAGS